MDWQGFGWPAGAPNRGCARREVEALEATALWRRDGRFVKNLGAPQGFPGAWFYAGGVTAQINLLSNLDLFDLDARSRFLNDV
jgi:hypothetical protein